MAETYLNELKRRLHVLHDRDDENLLDLIKIGHARVQGWCGQFELDNPTGRDLVFEYVRFVYNGKTEYFYECFKTDLVKFGFDLVGDEDEETGADS